MTPTPRGAANHRDASLLPPPLPTLFLLAPRPAIGYPKASLHEVPTMLTLFTLALSLPPADEPKVLFDAPIRLFADGLPLNQREQLLYPSPVLLDLDGSGQKKLVVGDLWGKLRVYSPLGKPGDLTWSKPTLLQANGKDLEVPNW